MGGARAHATTADPSWWRSGVLYQIYPRSFADADGDGHGDLQGVINHLDHLEWLGIDAIWLGPITPSPNADWGYDVADYTSVDPVFGDLGTLDRLVRDAGERGIRVILDIVPNHTSDRHPWFVDARSGRSAAHRDWYVWADAKPDGSPPNNWVSVFGGSSWTWDEPTEQFYLHNFLREQPDLNWWNPQVRDAFDDILRSWFDRGVAGFRIDVANGIVKDRALRDDPPVTDADPPRMQARGLRPVFSMNRPEVHDVFRRWRTVADRYEPARVLLGETWVFDLASLVRFYGDGTNELDLALNFPFMFAELDPGLRSIVAALEGAIPPGAWPAWAGSNHDVGRFPTRWGRGDERRTRAALLILLTLRGTPLLYYGDEIGMPEVPVPRERSLDPVGIRGWPEDPGRDGARTPMRWTAEATGGFTRSGVEPWLPVGDAASCNVTDQRADPNSTLHLCRDLITVRRARPDLVRGAYAPIDTPAGVWAWRRGATTVVAANLSDHGAEVSVGPGAILLSTRREHDGRMVRTSLTLEPWEAVVVGSDG
jgi:alpha-glucosidase